jgi:CBS-domain-containing membrane protein
VPPSLHLFDRKIKRNFRRYLAQVGLAMSLLFLVLWVETYFTSEAQVRGLLLAVIASTAFILFALPENRTANPRNVLGGHAAGLLVGLAFALFLDDAATASSLVGGDLLFPLSAALSVGASMFVMAATNTEHPPAAGTALGLVFRGFDWHILLFVVFSVTVLVLTHVILRSKLKNLY